MINRISTDVEYVAHVLRTGGIAGIPTETVYGLAADALQADAVARVFSVKGRPTSHPLIVHLHPEHDYSRWGDFNAQARQLFEAFCPGPLTLLIPRTSLVPDWVTGGRDTVAVRFPALHITQELLQEINTGLVAPSANRFGKVSPTTAQHVIDDLGSDVDVVLEGGRCTIGIESTIVECIGNSVQVLRPGAITSDAIAEVIQQVPGTPSGDSRAPGMLQSHYAPRAQVVLVETAEEAESQLAHLREMGHTVSLLFFSDVSEYATKLYDALREADSRHVEIVIALLPEDEGIGIAIRDRLRKASAGR